MPDQLEIPRLTPSSNGHDCCYDRVAMTRLSLAALLPSLLAGCPQNGRPEILPIEAQTAFVGSRFELRIQASDPDGDALTFDFSCPTLELGNRARLVKVGNEGVFTWTPIASDVGEQQIDFTASDGGNTDIEPVSVTVKPSKAGESAPIFRKPLGEGTTLDLGQQTCITVEVAVEDSDSVSVDLRQLAPIAGSTFKSVGPLAASFNWCPTSTQANQQRFLLQLEADDHDNPPVRKDYTILIRSALPPGCPGDAPVIAHTPPAPQTTTDPISLAATITDDKGLKAGSPIVYYTTTAPPDPKKLDFKTLSQVSMTSSSGSSYTAKLPNPTAAAAAGESRTLYYVIVAEDDDDPSGSCDHRTQVPDGSVFQLVVTKPATTPSCTKTGECAPGQVCGPSGCVSDVCTPSDTNGDGLYQEQSNCPAKHFCPSKGPGVSPSSCVESCLASSDCKLAGYKCKVFDTVPGCGLEGTKNVGTGCSSFKECKGIAMCLPWKGGYCTVSDCDSYGSYSGACPTGSVCVPLPDSRFGIKVHYLCLKSCTSSSVCRTSDGYSCKTVKDDLDVDRQVCLL